MNLFFKAVHFSLLLACTVLCACAAKDQLRADLPCSGPTNLSESWQLSWRSGCRDIHNQRLGGSQIMHLVSHKGALYAANGYWMDQNNIWYGGRDPQVGWSQVLKTSQLDEPWQEDLRLGPQHLRTELLQSITFTQDFNGRPLPQPAHLLIAGTYDGAGKGVDIFVRDDETSEWTRTSVISGKTGESGENNSVRSALVFRDPVTGEQKLYVSVGVLGLYSAFYDPQVPGHLRWSVKPEPGSQTPTRVLSIVTNGDHLLMSDGSKIYRRTNGEHSSFETILDLSKEADPQTDRAIFQSIGGIRGLTVLEPTAQEPASMIFVWHRGKQSPACVIRLDPLSNGQYSRHQEICFSEMISRYLGGTPVSFVLAAYNRFLPIVEPNSQARFHVIGLEAYLSGDFGTQRLSTLIAPGQKKLQGGFYGGGLYALRDSQGAWKLGEVDGPFKSGHLPLVSIYTFAIAPFSPPHKPLIFMGGYDPNHMLATDTAWIADTDLSQFIQQASFK